MGFEACFCIPLVNWRNGFERILVIVKYFLWCVYIYISWLNRDEEAEK